MTDEPFAKLFDTPHGQLLAYLDETDEGDPCLHVIGAYCNNVRPATKLSWPAGKEGERKAEAALAITDQAAADKLAADLRAAVARLGSEAA